jgi:hypothetical protein
MDSEAEAEPKTALHSKGAPSLASSLCRVSVRERKSIVNALVPGINWHQKAGFQRGTFLLRHPPEHLLNAFNLDVQSFAERLSSATRASEI